MRYVVCWTFQDGRVYDEYWWVVSCASIATKHSNLTFQSNELLCSIHDTKWQSVLIDDFLIFQNNFDFEEFNLQRDHPSFIFISITWSIFSKFSRNIKISFNRDRARASTLLPPSNSKFLDISSEIEFITYYHNLKRSYFVAAFKTAFFFFFFLATRRSLETTRNKNIRAGQELEKESPRMNPRPCSLYARKYRRGGLLSLLLRPTLSVFSPRRGAAAPLAPRVQRVIPPWFIKGKSSGVNGVGGEKTKARVEGRAKG